MMLYQISSSSHVFEILSIHAWIFFLIDGSGQTCNPYPISCRICFDRTTGFLRFKKRKDIREINYFLDFLDVYTPSLKVW